MNKKFKQKIRKWIKNHVDLIMVIQSLLGIAFVWAVYLYTKNKCGVGFSWC